jgi:5-formyltetrahydrofolate cyclo-ligase
MMLTKSAIREEVSTWRRELPELSWSTQSQAICSRLLNLDQIRNASSIHAFWPIHLNKEVDIRPLIRFLFANNVNVFLPIVSGNQLKHGRYLGDQHLKPSRFGVFEPIPDGDFDAKLLDCILVPALAVDLFGNRIGYGKGYYDSFLQPLNVLKIAPIFENQIVEGIQAEPHDVSVDILVTELDIHHVI